MKILISADTYYPQVNGASYFAQRLAYNLQTHGHEVYVIAPSQSLKNTATIINDVQVFGVRSYPIFFYPKFRFCFFFFRNAFIQKTITNFKPDIIHIQAHFAIGRTVVKIAEEKHIPLVATNHFMPENLIHYIPFNSVIGSLVKEKAWKDFSKIFKKVGQITTPTVIAANLIQSHFDKPVIPISCGINLDIFKPQNNGGYLKKQYNIQDLPILLYVGRLDKEKNLDTVINAFSHAVKSVPFQLVIVGTGAEKNNLIALTRELDVDIYVTFTGFVSDADLPNFYALAYGFIIAGTAELQSIVTMEAMATGLPILAVNAVALPELVKDGQNGFLFDIKNIDDLSQKMVQLFSDTNLRNEMGAKSLELIAQHDIKKSIKKFEDIYTSEIAKSSS